MKNIAGLLQELKYTVIDGKPEGEISELVYDSRKVTKDCMFVCIKGAAYDSHDHTEEIARAGAKVIVAERPVKVPEGVTLVLVEDSRYALSMLSGAKAESDRNHRNQGKDHYYIYGKRNSGACWIQGGIDRNH